MSYRKTGVVYLAILVSSCICFAQSKHSCSTFMIAKGDSLVVGHNLDDYMEVPGVVVVNKRGVQKTNISWLDIRKGWRKKFPRVSWTSKYGSITYNTMGREFIDGGLNEAGLYIGEMTLMDTQFPTDESTPKIYHHFWMQYQLDNFATVDEVIQNLNGVMIDGHCKWHFFIADKQGNSAAIEYLNGKPVIHKNESLPSKILCNTTYSSDLDSLKLYQGYGGARLIDLNDKENTKRTVRGTEYIKQYISSSDKPIVDAAFELLALLDLGNNLWRVVYDLKGMKMYFRTYKSALIKEVKFSEFDFGGKAPLYIDIHTNAKGNVSKSFLSLDDRTSKKYIRKFWWEVNMGFFGNIFIKPIAVWGFGIRITNYTSGFYK